MKDAKMHIKKSHIRKIGAMLLGGVLLGTAACSSGGGAPDGGDGSAQSFKFTMASAVAQTHPSGQATTQWMDRVTELTDGRVTFDAVWSGALLPGNELLAGVGDGRADIGHTSASWHMAELPHASIVTVPFVSYDGEASTRALNELYTTNQAMHDEFASAGVELVSAQPLDVVLLGSKTPFQDISALQGQQVRATGEWIKALSLVGAEPVGVPYGETYEALQRGVVNGYALNWEAVYDLQLQEVAPLMEDPGVGQVSNMMLIFNSQKWASLPEDVRAAFDQATTEQVDSLSAVYEQLNKEQCQTIVDGGGKFSTWNDAAQKQWRDTAADTTRDAWIAGLPDPEEGRTFFDDYVSLMAEKTAASTWKSGIDICVSL